MYKIIPSNENKPKVSNNNGSQNVRSQNVKRLKKFDILTAYLLSGIAGDNLESPLSMKATLIFHVEKSSGKIINLGFKLDQPKNTENEVDIALTIEVNISSGNIAILDPDNEIKKLKKEDSANAFSDSLNAYKNYLANP